MISWVFAALLAIVAVGLWRLRHVGQRPKNYPPGPPTLPLIGNLHLMPKKDPHHQFKKWAEEYGPIYSLILGAQVMIVLSSDQAIRDILDKRSAIYSSRPDVYLGGLVSGNLRVLLMEYGPTWRMIRKLMHSILNVKVAKSYIPYQDLENKQMLSGILEEPDLFMDHIRRYTNSLTTQMIFGFRTTSIHDERLIRLYDGIEKFSTITGSGAAALLDVFPPLRYLPDIMLPMRRYAKLLHKNERRLFVGLWKETKKALQEGTAKPCFCSGIAQGQEVEKFSDDLAGYITGSLLEAGSDTTANTLMGFVQAVVLFPEVQRLAQEELDRVCGDRLPNMDDWSDLRYIRGCVKESLRWMPTDILGFPHCAIQDDYYKGYKIPKGASMTWNVWAVHMDPNRHANPRVFDPSRYEGDDTTSAESAQSQDVSKRDHFVFGAGRRVCQGMHIADRSLFLAMSRLLWAFHFDKATDAAGKEIIPDADALTEGFLIHPKPFPAKIVARSELRARTVKKAWDDCQPLLDDNKQWKEVPEGMIFSSYRPSAKDVEE